MTAPDTLAVATATDAVTRITGPVTDGAGHDRGTPGTRRGRGPRVLPPADGPRREVVQDGDRAVYNGFQARVGGHARDFRIRGFHEDATLRAARTSTAGRS